MSNLASLDDVNTHLDEFKLEGTDPTLELINLDVTRIIKGALTSIFSPTTLADWVDPDTTPEYIRSIAGRLAASALYAKRYSENSTEVPEYAQKLYNDAILMLNMVTSGTVTLEEVDEVVDTGNHLAEDSFWPDGSEDPKVAMDMKF